MKTLSYVLSAMAALVAVDVWAAVDANSTGYESASAYVDPYVSAQPAVQAAVATETPTTETTETSANEQAAKTEQDRKACEAARAKANETGEARLEHVADQKCTQIDVAAKEPVSGMTQTADAGERTIGSDRSTGMYYPPENSKVNGRELSWGLMESFKQQMSAAGYDDNAIAALAGNLQHESNMFVSNKWVWDAESGTHKLTTSNGALSRGDGGTSFGIAQFHDTSPGVGRATKMLNFVGGDNLSPAGLQGTRNKQIEYMIQELPKELGNSYSTFTNPNVSTEVKTGIIVQKYERPKEVAGELYGRMGGRDRLRSALGIQTAMNSEITYDTDSTNGTSKGGRPISNPNGTGAGNAYIAAAGQNGGLGVSLAQMLGLGGTATAVPSNNMMAAMLVNALMGNSANIEPAAGEGSTSATKSSTTIETVTESITPKGFDVAKAILEMCGDDLSSSEDAQMLKVKLCRTEA